MDSPFTRRETDSIGADMQQVPKRTAAEISLKYESLMKRREQRMPSTP
jgi:hypothetical protein